jgi:hypothetical protein
MASGSPTKDSLSAGSEIANGGHIARKPSRRQRWPLMAGILLVVLGLALGLGLGIGLKHRKHSQSSTTSNNGSAPMVPRSQLVDPSQFVLSPSFDINATAQSREFNWTLSKINADPAGTSKNMLVVNGISPGPTVEANIGDR